MWTPPECDMKWDADDERLYVTQGAHIGDTLIALDDTYENADKDWSFIAHARTDIPALLSEVERLRGENEALRRTCPACGSDDPDRYGVMMDWPMKGSGGAPCSHPWHAALTAKGASATDLDTQTATPAPEATGGRRGSAPTYDDSPLPDTVKAYEIEPTDPLVSAWRCCHSASAKGPWFIVEHANLIDALDEAFLAGSEQVAEQMEVVVEEAWRDGYRQGATDHDSVVVHDDSPSMSGRCARPCRACDHFAIKASKMEIPKAFRATETE